MKPVLDPASVRALDAACIAEAGLSAAGLMEQAARSASKIVKTLLRPDRRSRILIACGAGNNGGDGYAMAWMLADIADVTVIAMETSLHTTTETRLNRDKAAACSPIRSMHDVDTIADERWDVVIDALIGVGGSGNLRDPLRHVVDVLNGIHALKVAVDVPTGLDALTGSYDGTVFHAHHTITMAALKPGLLRGRGRRICGVLHHADIGAPDDLLWRYVRGFVLEGCDIRNLLPRREDETSKFDYGRVLVIAGSTAMSGAGSLCAHAAIASGAGLVELATPSVHPHTPREVITHVMPTTDTGTIAPSAKEALHALAERATVVAIGPGLGTHVDTISMMADLVNGLPAAKPVVIDADGLRIVPLLTRPMGNVILTPHLGEFARLLGEERTSIVDTVMERAEACARERGCIVHVKDVPSITTDGTTVCYTIDGNAGMSTAGSGDVLTGIIAAMCAQHVRPYMAASLGAFLHATAGDILAASQPMETMMAGDLIGAMKGAIPR